MKQTSMIKLSGDAGKGLSDLRKDAGTVAKWAKRKYQSRKLKKTKRRKRTTSKFDDYWLK